MRLALINVIIIVEHVSMGPPVYHQLLNILVYVPPVILVCLKVLYTVVKIKCMLIIQSSINPPSMTFTNLKGD